MEKKEALQKQISDYTHQLLKIQKQIDALVEKRWDIGRRKAAIQAKLFALK